MQLSFSNQLKSIPGVNVVSPTRNIDVKVAHSSLTPGADQEDTLIFSAIEPSVFRQIGNMVFIEGQENPDDNWNKLSQGDALFVSSVVAEELNLQVGDELTLQTKRGEHPFEVAAITTDFSGQGYVITSNYLALNRWFSESGSNRFTISVQQDYDIEAVAREIEERFGDRYNFDVKSTATFQESVFGALDDAFLLFDVLSMIGVVIGGLGVVNTMTINVMERTQEVGGLRSLGMTRTQVVRMILAEAFSMGLVGVIFGVFFGYAMSNVFITISSATTGYELNYIFSIQPYTTAILLVIGVSQIASIGPASRAARINIIEALKHE